MSQPLPVGKLPPELLGPLLSSIAEDPSVIIGPGVGRDAAAIRFGDRILVLKTDPITFATDEIGWYVPNVNANDIACLGARPRWMLVTALLPEHATTPELVNRIFGDLRQACEAIGITLVGGHTEITTGLDRPIIVGQMVGEADPEALIDPRSARAGDAIILARGIAIEGTALITREIPGELAPALGDDRVQRCRSFLHDPGISVVRAAGLLHKALGCRLHALHDPTEGGLATGLRELGVAAGLGLAVERERIVVYPETTAVCEALGLDPLGLIASGALLAVVDPTSADTALEVLERAGIPAAHIGRMLPDPEQVVMRTGRREEPLPVFAVDEIARLFAERTGGAPPTPDPSPNPGRGAGGGGRPSYRFGMALSAS